MPTEIDWTPFDKYTEDTITCGCGEVFRSHAKFSFQRRRLITRKPCPRCCSTDSAVRASSDPESMTIKRDDTDD